MATYRLDGFTDLPHTLTVAPAGRPRGRQLYWRYELTAGAEVIFTGDDLGSSADGCSTDQAARSALSFLTLRPGDTDADYFNDYTPAQQAWRDAHAEALAMALYTEHGEEVTDLGRYRQDPPTGVTAELENLATDSEFLATCGHLSGQLRNLATEIDRWTDALSGLPLPATITDPLDTAWEAVDQAATAIHTTESAFRDALATARDVAARGLTFTGNT